MLSASDRRERALRRAAQAVTVGFASLAAFQAALAAGAPLGDAAWGGAHAHLTMPQRVSSAVAVAFYIVAILIVRGRAAGRVERRYRWGAWGLAIALGLSGVANLASDSPWEHYLLAPVALVLAALCIVVAQGSEQVDRTGSRYLGG
jgi:hypothetical protein